MFDSIRLALESMKKQIQYVLVFALLLAISGFMFANASSTFTSVLQEFRSNSIISLSMIDLK